VSGKKVLGANLQMQASIPKSRDRVVDDLSQKIENLQRPLTPTIKREKTPVVTPRAEIENFQNSQKLPKLSKLRKQN
jgi:hypothetical protein